MANKLTSKKLQELIMEVLSESSSPSHPKDIRKALAAYDDFIAKGLTPKKARLETLKKLRPDYGNSMKATNKIIDDALASRDSGGKSDPDKEKIKPDPKPDKDKEEAERKEKEKKEREAKEEAERFEKEKKEREAKEEAERLEKEKEEAERKEKERIEKEEDTSWMADPLADVTLAALKATKPAYEGERQEILNFVKQVFKDGLTSKELTTLARLSEDEKALELDDIESLFGHDLQVKNDGTLNSTNKKKYELAQKVVNLLDDYASKVITNKTSFSSVERARDIARKALSAKKLFVNLLAKRRKLNVDQSGIELPFTAPASSDVSVTSGVDKTKIDPATIEVFADFFTETTLEGRIRELKEFSDAVVSKTLDDYPAGKVINGAALLNMLSRASRTQDGSAAGFSMEAFFAMLISGEKIGQSQGAGDFVGTDGKNYSSKYGQGRYPTTQAISNFTKEGETVTYVVGGKVVEVGADTAQRKFGTKISGGIPTQKYLAVEIGLYDLYIETPGQSLKVRKHGTTTELDAGQGETLAPHTDSDFYFGTVSAILSNLPTEDKFLIRFCDSESQSFKEAFSEALQASTQDTVRQVMKIYNRLKLIRESGTDLVKDNSVASAFSMADNYKTLKTEIQQLFNSINGDMTSKVDLAENKKNKTKSIKDLDKLIERVILEHINK